jgi:spartin
VRHRNLDEWRENVAKSQVRLCRSYNKRRSSTGALDFKQLGQLKAEMEDHSRLLLAIPNVSISQIYEGEQTELSKGTLDVKLLSYTVTPSGETIYGSDTASQLSHGPTSEPPIYTETDLSSSSEKPPVLSQRDFTLFLSSGDDFELPLPASTKIFPQGESAYLIPSQDIPNALIRLDLGSTPADDLETFEILLSQFTAYEERPNDRKRKDLVLIDSEDGRVIGSLPQSSVTVQEDPELSQPGHEKDPVLVDITSENDMTGTTLRISRAPLDHGMKSSIIDMADKISSGILYSSNTLAKGIDSSAQWYINRQPTRDLPVTFQPSTITNVRKIHHLSNNAVQLSAKATGLLASAAHSLGAGVRSRFVSESKKEKKKPGFLNKTLIAFETIADSIDVSTKQLLSSSSDAATNVVRHKYGEQAADISHSFGSAVRNVGLVYVDARGVTRKALIKGAAKGMLFKAKVGNGEEVLIGGGKPDAPLAESETEGSGYSNINHPGVLE